MNEIVYKGENNQVLTNSILVAEKFGKEHKNVLRDIRTLLGGLLKIEHTPMFEETVYINPQNGQTYPMFVMNRDGFSLLAMGFTGKKALEFKLGFIAAFNKMEAELRKGSHLIPQSFSEALMLAANQAKQIEEQQKMLVAKNATIDAQNNTISEMSSAISEMQVKVSYYDRILQSKGLMDIKQIAQDYGMSAQALNKMLWEMRIQYKVNKQWILYSPYNAMGYVHSDTIPITHSDGSPGTKLHTKWTQKGRLFLYEKLKKNNVLPLIER